MKKGCLILLVILGVLVLVLLIGAFFVDRHVRFLSEAPAVSYTKLEEAPNGIRVHVDPVELLSHFDVEKLNTTGHPLTGMLAPERFLPRELVAFLGPDKSGKTGELVLFAGERRLGPVIASLSQGQSIFRNAKVIRWKVPGIVREHQGVLAARGWFELDDDASNAIARGSAIEPEVPEGGHLAELIYDNRQGESHAVVLALCSILGLDMDDYVYGLTLRTIADVGVARAFVDWPKPDQLTIRMEINAADDAPADTAEALQNILELLQPQITSLLRTECGVRLTGGCLAGRDKVEAEYTLTNITALIPKPLNDALK